MKRIGYLLAMYAVVGLGIFSSCSSESDPVIESGEGGITLALTAETGFQSTKAVNEADYTNVDGYTVQIYKDGVSSPIVSCLYKNLTSESIYNADKSQYLLEVGKYTLKAFKGDENNNEIDASDKYMYVYGENSFTIEKSVIPVEVTCKPTCGRVTVVFDPSMDVYFSNYAINFSTKALASNSKVMIRNKQQSDPCYLKVEENEQITAEYKLTKTNGQNADFSKKYTLSPNKALQINVKAVVKQGNVGITIDIDDRTNDIPIDIEIPSWWK